MNIAQQSHSDQGKQLGFILQQVRHFQSLTQPTIDQLASIAICRSMEPDQVIYLEGELPKSVYLLEQGWVKCTRTSKTGREQSLMVIQSGEIFGEVAVFTNTAYPGTSTTLSPINLWCFPANAFLAAAEAHSDLALAVIRGLGERIQAYTNLIEDLSLRNVEERLAKTLLQHASIKNGRLSVRRESWANYDEMAGRLGTVRDVLSRAMRRMEQDGLIQVERSEIYILNPNRLRKRCNIHHPVET